MRRTCPVLFGLLLSAAVAAQAQFSYTTNADAISITLTGYIGSDTDLAIPSAIGGLNVTGIGSNVFLGDTNLVSVTIPGGVTSIGDYAFSGCAGLSSVTIPAGVTNGQRIRLAGQGGRGAEGASAGDLYLIVRIARNPRYRVEGRDLHVELPLAPWEAALGTTAAVDTPDGEAKVKVPAGTSSGRRLRLRGRGLPNPRGTPGDLLAEVKIMVPEKLSPEERRLFTELTATSTFSPRKRQ